MLSVSLKFSFYISDDSFGGYTDNIPVFEDDSATDKYYFYSVSVKHRNVCIKKFFKSDNVSLVSSSDFVGGLSDIVTWFKDENIVLCFD